MKKETICAPGDKVFVLYKGKIQQLEVKEVHIKIFGTLPSGEYIPDIHSGLCFTTKDELIKSLDTP